MPERATARNSVGITRVQRLSHLRPVASDEPLLSRESLAERLDMSVDTLDRMRASDPAFPEVRWGRRLVRFRYSDVIRWLEDETRKAA